MLRQLGHGAGERGGGGRWGTGVVAAEVDAPAPQDERDPQAAVHRAYRELVGATADWLPLRRLREHLADLDREQVDRALAGLLDSHAVRLIPETNQKMLTPADHDAAIWLGGQYRHLIAIEAR